MARFVIQGGRRLRGVFRPAGNKNAALPMLAAALLTDEPVVLSNVPAIRDVECLLDLLAAIGADVSRDGGRVTVCAAGVRTTDLPADLCLRVRGSILLAGPLAARHGAVALPPPGGDVIGRRRLDTHFEGLARLGVELSPDLSSGAFRLRRAPRFAGASILLDEASVTATENLLMAAALAPGETVLFNAACEPHVQNLAALLAAMGADISGAGTNRVTIRGVPSLHGASARVQPDAVELGSFLAAAAATGGSLDVGDLPDEVSLRLLERLFGRLGIAWTRTPRRLRLPVRQKRSVTPDLGGSIPKIEDGIWPAIPSDLLSVAIVLATQTAGDVLFFEKLFESRMYFVDRLLEMGARIVACDPHRVLVSGPSPLRAKHMTSPDIRAGMALVIAALCASGTSFIDNAEMIDRGYERLDERLRALGADILREP